MNRRSFLSALADAWRPIWQLTTVAVVGGLAIYAVLDLARIEVPAGFWGGFVATTCGLILFKAWQEVWREPT